MVTDNATGTTPRDEVEEYFNEQGNGTSDANTVTRDSQTVLLEGESLPKAVLSICMTLHHIKL